MKIPYLAQVLAIIGPEISFWKSNPGEIGPDRYWCAYGAGFFYTEDTFWRLIRQIITEYQNDKHLVG